MNPNNWQLIPKLAVANILLSACTSIIQEPQSVDTDDYSIVFVDGKLQAKTPCHQFAGDYHLKNDELQILSTELIETEPTCNNAQLLEESFYMEPLGLVRTVRVEGTFMEMHTLRGEIVRYTDTKQ